MKARAPPPPQAPQPAPRHIFRNNVPDGGGTSGIDAKENILRPTVDLQLTLPQGHQTSITEDGSKALMDLLVELCSRYHLNPALHTLELLSPEGHNLGFKPNALLGSLNALIPVICDKCDFDAAHVLLLKDSISHHELPLDRSLTELGIKELYVHDQSLDSICSSTTSLGRAEKKGLLGIFQFSKRKSKGASTVSGISIEDRPSTLGQSQSVMNIPRMSPKAETKKRRAPALPGASTPSMGYTSFEGYQMGLGSESQQRKRKAPAPPPTPSSITPGLDDTSASATPTPDSHANETSTLAFNKVTQSTTISTTTVVTQTVKPGPLKTAVQPPTVCVTSTTLSQSPTPSNSTTDSLAVQDSSSELSHSLDDSDTDLDQTGSQCSSITSSTVSGSVQVQSSSSKMKESERSSSTTAKLNQETTSASSSRSDTESALNLKLDEVENNRHSAMGTTDRPAPPKPRRSPAREPPQLVLPPTPSSPPIEPTESNSPQSPMKAEEAAPQSWLHSRASGQKSEIETPEEETTSLGSSSGGSSLPDQGYAASEGMAEGEDSGMVSSPSDTQPTSPDGSLSLDGCGGGVGGRLLGPVRDNSSDSDEGCATWGSRHRHNDISPQPKSGKVKGYEEDPELTAQLHQTLADLEAGLADHIDIVSAKETPYTMSTDSNEVPVSVVDMDVPVTAIDEVLEDYERNIVENEAKSLTRTASANSKGPGFCHLSSVELQNKNNNACTAADTNKSSSTNTKQSSQPEQHKKSQGKSKTDKKEENMLEAKMKERSVTGINSVKEAKAGKSNVDMQKHSKSTEIKPDPVKSNAQSLQEKEPVLPDSQRTVPTKRDEGIHRVQNNSSSSNSYGKITQNVTSRFGLKTFTVVPPKPSVSHAASGVPAVSTVSAIKIDDQGNMVKVAISRNKVGASSESGINYSEGSPLLGKAKAFWSSNERQESAVPYNKGLIDKAKESTDGLKRTPSAISETTLKTTNIEDLKTTQFPLHKPAERAPPKEGKEEAKELAKDIKTAKEELVELDSKISVSKNVQQPSNKPALPPPILPDLRKDLSFLKPSRRTSSQYVASAINKYTPKTSVKPSSIPNVPDSSASLKTQTIDFQRSGRSIQVNPHQSSSLSDNKENESAFKSNPSGPKRSVSYPEHMSDSQRNFGEVRPDSGGFGSYVGSIKGNSNAIETETTKNKPIQSGSPAQINITTNNDRDNIKNIQPRNPSLAKICPLNSSAKPPTAPKTVYQGQTSNTRDMPKAATNLTPEEKAQPSVTVADSGLAPGPPPVTVFGPVKKFRPVICKSVEKETSLHSSLMEAIQTGGGRDRLKKISTSGPSSMKNTSYVEEENERSALLAAIRAQNNSGRLRKTKSEAADELERFRKTPEEDKSAGPPYSPSSLSSTCTSLPVFTPPPPPPPAPMIAPPPPVLPQGKPSTVAHPSSNTSMNPAMAREAMLEAIRSGSAAERLKKVAVPTKTVKVNGRLGTIQADSSTLPQQ
ncbi:Protein cordon-bleu [Nibea albiflora]|uniref:Protein cordon-bleu n=1 Tax=Nibea albiflora TaxID=240163 RepID=A0ACB7F6S5_NIBAL|nr:Protein cordon-bleu [Nibea albiflora]